MLANVLMTDRGFGAQRLRRLFIRLIANNHSFHAVMRTYQASVLPWPHCDDGVQSYGGRIIGKSRFLGQTATVFTRLLHSS